MRIRALGAVVAVVCTCLVASAVPAQSQSPGAGLVSFTVPVDKVFEQLRLALDDIVNLVHQSKLQVRADSVGRLALDVSLLAADERGLSIMLLSWQPTPGQGIPPSADADRRVEMLQHRMENIRTEYAQVDQDLRGLDPNWAPKHVGAIVDIGRFTHDGIICYHAPDPAGAVPSSASCGSGPGRIVMADPAQFAAFVSALSQESKELEQIAAKLGAP